MELHELLANSVDVLFIGASTIYHTVSPLQIYDERAFLSAVYATAAQDTELSYFFAREAFREQKPKVLVLDANGLFKNGNTEGTWERGKLALTSSDLKWQISLINNTQNHPGLTKGEIYRAALDDFLFPFYRYHNRWNQRCSYDFELSRENEKYTKGHMDYSRIKSVPFDQELAERLAKEKRSNTFLLERSYVEGKAEGRGQGEAPLYTYKLAYKKDIESLKKELCDQNDCALLLVHTPKLINPVYQDEAWTMEQHEAIEKTAKEHGISFLDLTYDAELEIDWGYDPS
ncbi:MAG: hypothetical protein IJU66_07805 [Oscillospiraceae bacterium]|nr:hypothetical protein [Oscillospiraceae bacterium]